MHKVFISRQIPPSGIKRLKENNIEVLLSPTDRPLSKEELISYTKDCDALISMLSDEIDENFLKSCPNLKVISNFAVGHNNIDIESASQKKVAIGNTPDVLTNATAELTMSLMFSCARKVRPAIKFVEEGLWRGWEPLGHLGKELTGATLGIVGAGRIGQRVGEICHNGLSMNVLYTANSNKKDFEKRTGAKKVDLNQLLEESDIVSVHCPLTPQTKNLFNKETFKKMKKDSIFINTSRGEVHNEDDLYEIILSKGIAAAGLDVTNPEPIDSKSPLLKCDNVIILPHIGSATSKARENMSEICALNIIQGLNNLPLKGDVNNLHR